MTLPDHDRRVLCRMEDIERGGAREFEVTIGGARRDVFVVRTDAGLFAYLNSCPHTGAPLNWRPDQFLSPDGTQIQCANHDARFRVDDGVCVSGPCPGSALTPIRTEIVDGRIVVPNAIDRGRGAEG